MAAFHGPLPRRSDRVACVSPTTAFVVELARGSPAEDLEGYDGACIKPVTAVGIAFAAQEVPKIPTTPRDERLDLVLTEREVIDLRGH